MTIEAVIDAAVATPRHFLILNNVQKIKNIKNMLVGASVFGVKEVFVVGQKTFDLQEQKPFLSSLSCQVTRMATLKVCKAHCKERGIRIIGVEIMQNARSVAGHPFCGDSAFIMGNEGSGMNSAQVAICDDFVFIPQYGGGTASLNVTVAASIVLQSFALWANLPVAS
uniref:tRNA/rRNA methyltransferase SpoU type domain-containing protein n=1 Tax=Peronospora matthiolae TaxID=2874970 RepID=A0AAV1UPB4_9STRA